ncbi:MAG: hypothetical protein IKH07_08245 [Oscillospiraceae bacterium]|nr:hypothetical protein [Oscillospiraceae bacterium]
MIFAIIFSLSKRLLHLLIGGFLFRRRQIGVLRINRDADIHIRRFSDQLNNRLDMPWDNSVNKNAVINAVATTLGVRNMPLTS